MKKITLLSFLCLSLSSVSAFAAPDLKEARDQAKAIVEDASAAKSPAAAASRKEQAAKAVSASAAKAEFDGVCEEPGFKKFLAIKELGVEKSADGKVVAVSERSRPVEGSGAVQALLANFRAWDGKAPKAANGCLEAGDPCSSSIWCCRSMLCTGGSCGGSNNDCVKRGRRCSSSVWCCGTGICNDQGYCQ